MGYQEQSDADLAWTAANDAAVQSLARPFGEARQINATGLNIIKKFKAASLTAYKTPGGYAAGYGVRDKGFDGDSSITREEALMSLYHDLDRIEAVVEQRTRVPLSQNQFSALVSLAHDIGVRTFRNSAMLKFLNNGEDAAALLEFDRWIAQDGELRPEIARRRMAERNLFLRPDGEENPGRDEWVAETVRVGDVDLAGPPVRYRARRKNLLRQSRTVHGAGVVGLSGLVMALSNVGQIIKTEDLDLKGFREAIDSEGAVAVAYGLVQWLIGVIYRTFDESAELIDSIRSLGIDERLTGGVVLVALGWVAWARFDDRKKARR